MFVFIITGDLTDNLFSESVGGEPPVKKDKSNKKRGRPISDQERKMQLSFEKKNKAVEFTLFCETSANLSSNLRELNSSKRKLFRGFTEHCGGDKKVAKARLRLIRAKRKCGNMDKGNVSESDDSIDEYEDLQESTLMEICDVEEAIEMAKADLDTVQKKKKDASNALENTK